MKIRSIKLRVTLWYSLLMLLLCGLVLGFMVFASGKIAQSGAKDALIAVVDDNLSEIEYDDGELDIDDDFAYQKNGVTSVIYSENGQLLDGYLPGGFDVEEPLLEGEVRTVIINGQPYSVYDKQLSDKAGGLWVRGIILADGTGGVLQTVLKAAFILLPFIVLAAAAVGYRIAKSAFAPIERIASTANAIEAGDDLSRRIGLDGGQDEIYRLAATFDRMFDRLEASFEEEKQFTSDVSHELRTPTSVILAQCEYALAHDATEADYRDSLLTVQRQATRMSHLIAELLSFTRLTQGQEPAAFEDTDISELVTIVCEEQAKIGENGITLYKEIPPDIHAMVDRTLFTRLLFNLIGNAYQYGRENGRISVRLDRQGDNIRLSVADDGIGISSEHLDHIWRRFYQADPARTARESGSMGLGLSMVDKIANIHGGDVSVESVVGKGSKFTVTIPAKKERL